MVGANHSLGIHHDEALLVSQCGEAGAAFLLHGITAMTVEVEDDGLARIGSVAGRQVKTIDARESARGDSLFRTASWQERCRLATARTWKRHRDGRSFCQKGTRRVRRRVRGKQRATGWDEDKDGQDDDDGQRYSVARVAHEDPFLALVLAASWLTRTLQAFCCSCRA